MISNYNNSIIPTMVEFVKHLMEVLPKYDQAGREIKVLNYEVLQGDSEDISYYLRNELTAEWTIIFYYEITREGESIAKSEFELMIPRIINNAFVIEGKLRIPTITLGSDSDCRAYENHIVFDWSKSVGVNPETGKLTLELSDDTLEEPIVVDGTAENFEKYRELLKLSRRQVLKLQVKLDRDLQTDYITEDLCRELIRKGEDKLEDSIVDKLFIDPESALTRYIQQHSKRKEMLSQMRKKFYRYDQVYITDLQRILYSYFKVANDSTVEIPQNVNPLVYNSLSSKLVLPKFVAYNKSFADLIDPVNTPENNNVNRINELNVCCSLEQGEPFIWCYAYPSFEKIKVNYLEYLNTKVIKNTCVDYKRKALKEGNITYKLRLKEYPVGEINLSENYLVEPKSDEKLSLTSRQIPLINSSDTVRVAMGAGMSKQAVELENAEPPVVSAGNEKEDEHFDTSKLYWQNGKGIVKKITPSSIFVELEDKSVVPFDIPSTTVGLNNTLISYKVMVKEGDVIDNKSLLVSSYMTQQGGYNLGVNAKVAYTFYKGYNHEDAIIVSESFAERCKSYQIFDVTCDVACNDDISALRPIGSLVSSKDIIVARSSKFIPRNSSEEMLSGQLFQFLAPAISYFKNNVEVPNNIEEGYILDISYDLMSEREAMDVAARNEEDPEKTKVLLNTLKEVISKNEARTTKPLNIPARYWNMKVDGIESDRENSIGTITFRILRVSKLHEGSKMCNRWGAKGEISLVLPDDQMLHDEAGRPFDMILNPPSVISRMNPSQLTEILLSKIAKKVHSWLIEKVNDCDLAASRGDDTIAETAHTCRELMAPYYEEEYEDTEDTALLELIRKGPVPFKVGSYSTFGRTKVLELAERAGVQETEYVTDPDPEIGELEAPVLTGESYYMRLYHSSDFTAKATSSVVDGKEPSMGRGSYRPEGQKIGEMERWALMAHGVNELLSPNSLQKEGFFLNELLLAGYYLEMNGNKATLSENFRALKQRQKSIRDNEKEK